MVKTSNIKCSELVNKKIQFKANNIFSEYIKKDKLYIVYSYGYHFPMYIKYKNTWYENSDKYSISTSKQQTQLRPCTDMLGSFTRCMASTKEMQEIISINKSN